MRWAVVFGRRRTFLVALVAAGAAGVGGSLVLADTTSTIQGCVSNTGTLRIISDPTGFHANACGAFEHGVTINQTGPPGPPGPAGPPGPGGTPGASGKDGTPAATPATTGNFIAGLAFAMPNQTFVRAEVICPNGDLATGGAAAIVSPLGELPAFDGPSAGPTVVSAPGHPSVGWFAEARNTTGQAASLRITTVCAGPVSDAKAVRGRVILVRKLHAPKAKKR